MTPRPGAGLRLSPAGGGRGAAPGEGGALSPEGAPPPPAFASRPRSAAALAAIAIAALAVFATFIGLGVWQLERRAWKLDLIERVELRLRAAPEPAPGPAGWPEVSAPRDEYRRVTVSGVFDHGRETLTQAATDHGAGFWVLTPVRTDAGWSVLVNRGFVPPERRDPATRRAGAAQGVTVVTGLMRMTEPKGGFLRANDPAAGLWRSRDVAAIAAARGVSGAAPYFVDAGAEAGTPPGQPIAGLTVVAFRNAHLVYALTWFALAAMTAFGAGLVARHEIALRRRAGRAP